MHSYRYTARDMKGHVHTGIVAASNEQDARRALREKQLYITEITCEDPSLLRSLLRMVRPSA